MRKLFVVTSGTIAAGVGQELERQMREHPDGELLVKARYLDTARLDNRLPVRDGEWRQMHIDPIFMRAAYQQRKTNHRLDAMLYDGLLPKTTGVGASSIRYNGAGAVIVNRDSIKRWLSANMTDLARSGDGRVNLSTALIVSSVGATGSGSAEHLAELIADAAYDANISLPVRCDIFILQPGMVDVRDIGLANSFALYAELAASRLAQNDIQIKRYQGRIMMVGWGSTTTLQNIEQLQQTTATLVRLINDPVTDFVAEFQEREADNHVLLQLDSLTGLPTHLSSATAVTISLGSLKEQIIEREAAILVNNLVFGTDMNNKTRNVFMGTLAESMPGEDAAARYRSLIEYLAADSTSGFRTRKSSARQGVLSEQPSMQGTVINNWWQQDRAKIDQGMQDVDERGRKLIDDIGYNLQNQQRNGIRVSTLSLASIRDAYRVFVQEIAETLNVARQAVNTTVDQNSVTKHVNALNEAANGRRRINQRDREAAIDAALREVRRNLDGYLDRRLNPTAIEVLEELEYNGNEQLRKLEALLVRLDKQRRSDNSWSAASRPLTLGISHPLSIPALTNRKVADDKSEIDRYYERVSIFTARTRRRNVVSGQSIEQEQLSEFRQWLDDEKLTDLFKGDVDRLLKVTQGYVNERVSAEVEKRSVLDVLLDDGEETLLSRLREAATLATPLVNFNTGFAPDRVEVWHLCAYYKNDEQRRDLERAMREAFGQGRCTLIKSADPTEIVAFYYIDGLPISAIQDLTGRCLDAFLNRRMHWEDQALNNGSNDGQGGPNAMLPVAQEKNNKNNELNPTQQVGIPIYSGQDAENRVIQQNVVCKVCRATARQFPEYSKLKELGNCKDMTEPWIR